MVCVKAVVFLFLAACGGTTMTGDDAAVTSDAAADDVADAASDAPTVPGCSVACDYASYKPTCCDDGDGGALVHTCSDAGIVTPTTTTCGP